jgi:hypothetical protein
VYLNLSRWFVLGKNLVQWRDRKTVFTDSYFGINFYKMSFYYVHLTFFIYNYGTIHGTSFACTCLWIWQIETVQVYIIHLSLFKVFNCNTIYSVAGTVIEIDRCSNVLLFWLLTNKLQINKQYYCINICLLFWVCYMFRSSWIIIRQFSWCITHYWIVFVMSIYISNYFNINFIANFYISLCY